MHFRTVFFFSAVSDAFNFLRYFSFGKGHGINLSVLTYRNIQKTGQRIHNTGSYTVQSAGDLISGSAELSAGMKYGKYNFKCRLSGFLLDIYRNSSTVILYGYRIVFMYANGDTVTKTGQRFIYGIIHYFINKVMQAANRSTPDIHSGTLSNRFQSFQYLNLIRTVLLRRMKLLIQILLFSLYCHESSSIYLPVILPFSTKYNLSMGKRFSTKSSKPVQVIILCTSFISSKR